VPEKAIWNIITDLSRTAATGLLIVRIPNMEKRVYLKLGFLRQIDSIPPDPREMFGVLLRSQGKLTDEDIRNSLKVMEEKHVFQGEALLLIGKLKLDELDNLLTWQQNIKLFNLLSANEFHWEFKELPTEKIPKGCNINLFGNVYLFLKKTLSISDVKQYIDDNVQNYLLPVLPPPFNPDECFVKREDKKFYEIIAKTSPPIRIQQVFDRSPFSRNETSVTIYAISKMGFVNIQQKIETTDFDIKKYKELCKEFTETMNYFEIVGVHWSCCMDEISTADEKRKKEFSIREKDTQEIVELKKKILNKVDEAYNFLKIEKNRIAYRKEILDKFKVESGALILFEKGEISLELRYNLDEAFELYNSAHDLAPNNIDYAAAFGFVKHKRFKTTNTALSREGEKLVEMAVSKNPKSYYTRYYRARLYEEKGMIPQAIQELKAAIDINPSKLTARDMMKRLLKGSG